MCRLVLLIPFFLIAVPIFPQAGSPQKLHAVSASSHEVKLAWTPVAGASGYTLERKPLGGPFAPLGPTPLPDAQASDSTIAALTTYVYRVKVNGAAAAPSNEITVGPPPVGYSLVVPTPAKLEGDERRQFAMYPQMVLDANGDPAAAYYFNIRTGDDESQSTIYFVSWDRANYRWNTPVAVEKVGVVGKPSPLSLARDASTNLYAIVSETTGNHSLPLAVSTDNGMTWQVKPVVTFGEDTNVTCPSIALAAGSAFLAYGQSNSPLQYATGKETDDPSTWNKTPVPNAVEGEANRASLSIAVDSAGKPGLAYVIGPNTGYNVTVAFWRPGGTAARVTDSRNFQMDDPQVTLAFAGAKPRILVYIGRTETRFTNNEYNYFSAAADEGGSWAETAYIPNDGKESMWGTSLAIGAKGEGAVLLDITGGSGDGRCGVPKLSRSNDMAHWTTCSPTGAGKPKLTSANSGKLAYAANGKLYALIANQAQDKVNDGPGPQGLALWREP